MFQDVRSQTLIPHAMQQQGDAQAAGAHQLSSLAVSRQAPSGDHLTPRRKLELGVRAALLAAAYPCWSGCKRDQSHPEQASEGSEGNSRRQAATRPISNSIKCMAPAYSRCTLYKSSGAGLNSSSSSSAAMVCRLAAGPASNSDRSPGLVFSAHASALGANVRVLAPWPAGSVLCGESSSRGRRPCHPLVAYCAGNKLLVRPRESVGLHRPPVHVFLPTLSAGPLRRQAGVFALWTVIGRFQGVEQSGGRAACQGAALARRRRHKVPGSASWSAKQKPVVGNVLILRCERPPSHILTSCHAAPTPMCRADSVCTSTTPGSQRRRRRRLLCQPRGGKQQAHSRAAQPSSFQS